MSTIQQEGGYRFFRGWQARKQNGALDVGVEGAVGPGLMGDYQLAGFVSGKGETGIPGPIFC
ncbi:MAG: hypothetical protein E5X98_17260, partial [Mesorhizobium sp.]